MSLICKKVTNHNDSESGAEEDNTTLELDSASVWITSVSNSDAMIMFDGCITWFHQQKEANTYNLAIVDGLRELATKKRLSNLKPRLKPNSSVFGLTEYYSTNSWYFVARRISVFGTVETGFFYTPFPRKIVKKIRLSKNPVSYPYPLLWS